MVNVNVRMLLFLSVAAILAGCEAPTDEHDEGTVAHSEALPSDEPAAEDAVADPDWAGPTQVETDWAGPTEVGDGRSGEASADWAGPTKVDESERGEASADWAGPTAVDKASALACWPRIEASGWYCCGRFRECKAVYICEYCTNSKSCYRQGGIQERSSPGCY
jgi:hypothetical protein